MWLSEATVKNGSICEKQMCDINNLPAVLLSVLFFWSFTECSYNNSHKTFIHREKYEQKRKIKNKPKNIAQYDGDLAQFLFFYLYISFFFDRKKALTPKPILSIFQHCSCFLSNKKSSWTKGNLEIFNIRWYQLVIHSFIHFFHY